jgi:hypothetical protein
VTAALANWLSAALSPRSLDQSPRSAAKFTNMKSKALYSAKKLSDLSLCEAELEGSDRELQEFDSLVPNSERGELTCDPQPNSALCDTAFLRVHPSTLDIRRRV